MQPETTTSAQNAIPTANPGESLSRKVHPETRTRRNEPDGLLNSRSVLALRAKVQPVTETPTVTAVDSLAW